MKKIIYVLFVIIIAAMILFSCSQNNENESLTAIHVPDNIFGTEDIGMTKDELLASKPDISSEYVSNELIDGENLYIYDEVQSGAEFETVYYYYVYKNALVGTATEYTLKKSAEDISKEEFLRAVSESMVSLRNSVEEMYDLEETYDGIHYKYDGDILKHKPTMNGVWRNDDVEIYIATSVYEREDYVATIYITYGAVTTDKIGQDTALDHVSADSEIYEEEMIVTFQIKPDGETSVECKLKVLVYKETTNGIEQTYIRSISDIEQYALSQEPSLYNERCSYWYTNENIRVNLYGTLITEVLPENKQHRYYNMNYIIGRDGRGRFAYRSGVTLSL